MQAGLVIGSEGTASLGKMDISILNDAPNFMLKETRKIGNDTLSIWARSA
jgi:riboflavin biosynthesis pyrimidine reductase